MKNQNTLFWIIGIIILSIFLHQQGIFKMEEGVNNGYWDEATNQCWPDKYSPAGGQYPIGDEGVSKMYQCCLNQVGQQVDCNNPSTLLGPFAIYEGSTGVFSVAHSITISNTGNVALTKAWIESATWTPVHATLTTAYSGMIGAASTQAGPISLASYRPFSTTGIDLQAIGGAPGSPITYDLSLVTMASALGLSDSSKTTPASIIVEKEGIQFNVDISLGA